MIFVNQAGYLPKSKKKASSLAGGTFHVLDKKRNISVYSGYAKHFGRDEASGDEIYHMDFTELETPGEH